MEMVPTPPLPQEGGTSKVPTNEMKVKMKRTWKWRILSRDTRRATRRRGKEQTPTQHTSPGAGKPWKGKRREKRRLTDTEQDQRRGGRTEAPEPIYPGETYAYRSTHRTQPTWRRERAWNNKGPNGGLVDENWCTHKIMQDRYIRLNGQRVQDNPIYSWRRRPLN